MNELELWSKTLLTCYEVLPKILKSIDKCNFDIALGSFYYNGNSMDIMEQMLTANKRKEQLVNLYVITTKALGLIKETHREVLELKLQKRMKFDKIAEVIGSCERTVFRRYSHGIVEFGEKLLSLGYDDKWFAKRYANDICIGKFFEKIKEKSLMGKSIEEIKSNPIENSQSGESQRQNSQCKNSQCIEQSLRTKAFVIFSQQINNVDRLAAIV